MSTIVPELKLYRLINALVDQVAVDYNSHTDKNKTFLYKLFGSDSTLGKYDYYAQSVDLFVGRGIDHPRKMDVRMMFDSAIATVPTMHITTPSENNSFNEIGVGESGLERNVDYDPLTNSNTPIYNRRFQAQYYVICTSESSQEVFLMYHVLKAMMISALDWINLAGFENPQLSGQEIRQNDQSVPNHIYMRGVGLSCHYTMEVPRYFDTKIITDIALSVTPIIQ
jgi:hypothetical protein